MTPRIPTNEPDHAPDAESMVPGMMRLEGEFPYYSPLGGFGFRKVPQFGSGGTVVFELGDPREMIDKRTPAEFAAAYTAAWEYTERRRAEIAEEVRRDADAREHSDDLTAAYVMGAHDATAPDLGEWPGKPDVPPEHCRDVEILTPHGALLGDYLLGEWRLFCCQQDYAVIDPRDVLRWRELPLAVIEYGRVTGVTRG